MGGGLFSYTIDALEAVILQRDVFEHDDDADDADGLVFCLPFLDIFVSRYNKQVHDGLQTKKNHEGRCRCFHCIQVCV